MRAEIQVSAPPTRINEAADQLSTLLEKRPPKEQLQNQRILKRGRELQRAQLKDTLKNGLAKRRSIREVFHKGVFPENQAGGEHYKEYKSLALADFLKSRPTMQTLIDNRLVEDTLTWSKFTQDGELPEKRNCHNSCIVGNKLYVFGGYGIQNESFLNVRTFNLDTKSWNTPQCAAAGMFPRNRYSSSCVVLGKRILIFGGFSPEGYWLNDLHVLDTESDDSRYTHMWYQPETSGQPPSPRAAHSCTLVGRKLFFFGGNDGQTLYDDLHILDTETFHWQKMHPQGLQPLARSGHSALLVKDKIVIFGGGGLGGTPMNDVHYLDCMGGRLVWSQPSLRGTGPSPRAGHTACVLHGNCLLIFGGGYIDKVYNDVHMLNVEKSQWSRPADTGDVPCARTGHSMNTVKSLIFVFGGCDSSGMMYNDLYLLDATFFRTQYQGMFASQANSPLVTPGSPGNFRIDALPLAAELSLEEQQFFTSVLDDTSSTVNNLLNKVDDQIKEKQSEMTMNQQSMLAQVKMYHQTYEDSFNKLRSDLQEVKYLVENELATLKASLAGFLSSPRRRASAEELPGSAPKPVTKRRSLQPQKPGMLPVQNQIVISEHCVDDLEVKESENDHPEVTKGDSYLRVPPAAAAHDTIDTSEDLMPQAFFCDDEFFNASNDSDTDSASIGSPLTPSSDYSSSSASAASNPLEPVKAPSYKASAQLRDLIARDMKEGDLNPPKKRRKRRKKKQKRNGRGNHGGSPGGRHHHHQGYAL